MARKPPQNSRTGSTEESPGARILVTAGTIRRRVVASLAAIALVLSVYLTVLSLSKRGAPIGCGPGSPCDQVLTSRWSTIAGVPVSLPACIVYGLILISVIFQETGGSAGAVRLTWFFLVALAVVAGGAALWFLYLQYFRIHAFCPYCTGSHICGLVIALIVLWRPRLAAVAPAVGGLVLVAAFAGAQVAIEPAAPPAQRGPASSGSDTGAGSDRVVELLDGKLKFKPHEVPIIGSPDAKHILVFVFDPICLHCRASHRLLGHVVEYYPDEIAVAMFPSPLDGDCNPRVQNTPAAFADSCETAQVAVAVFRADPTKFPDFDRWLFLSRKSPSLVAVRVRARQLIGLEALETALADPWVVEHVKRGVQAFADSQVLRIPVVMSEGLDRPIVGRWGSYSELIQMLRTELGIL